MSVIVVLRRLAALAWLAGALAAADPVLALTGASSEHGWVVAPGAGDRVVFQLDNRGPARSASLRWQVLAPGGRVVRNLVATQVLPAGASEAALTVDAGALALGDHAVRLTVAGADPAGPPALAAERTLMVADPGDAVLIFDREPVVRGLDFVRTRIAPEAVAVDGVQRWVWRAGHGSAALGWWRSLQVLVTDPALAGGRSPVVDVVVTLRHQPDAPLVLKADGAEGEAVLLSTRGRQSTWKTFTLPFDQALFARSRRSAEAKEMAADGCDLRLNMCSDSADLRSIRIHRYDLERPTDWGRLLRCDGAAAAGRTRFVFAPGEPAGLELRLRNLARVPFTGIWSVRLADDLGTVRSTRQGALAVPAGSAGRVDLAVGTVGLALGVHQLDTVVEAGGAAVLERRTRFLVGDSEPLPRAAPGGFLYGLNTGVHIDGRDAWLEWADFLGVDLVRGLGTEDPAQMEVAWQRYHAHRLGAVMNLMPRWSPEPARREELRQRALRDAADLAGRFRGRIRYWELGNEPDLPFFYPGPIEDYVADATALYRTIKSVDPQAVVMNGGLCFAGREGAPRARRLVELMPADVLDAWAYHGHGPGLAAEREALERLRAEAAKHGKAGRPFLETESGVAGTTLAQLRVQARTCVQKFVYAQAEGMDFLLWFTLYMSGHESGYAMLDDISQPRPVVAAYRTLVRTLRGLRWDRRAELGDLEGWQFAQADGARRALVCWSDLRPGQRRLRLPPGAEQVRRVDLFGNTAPLVLDADGAVAVEAGADPLYVCWQGGGGAVTLAPAAITAPATLVLAPGGNQLEVVVRAVGGRALAGTVAVEAGGGLAARQSGSPVAVALAAGQEQALTIAVVAEPPAAVLAWPGTWTVFSDLPPGAIDAGGITAIPERLEAAGRGWPGRRTAARDGLVDIGRLAGAVRERAEALLCAEVVSERAQRVQVGASADWWMEWLVNGRRVYDTLGEGNRGGYALTDHQFAVDLQAGRNLLVVRVLSGSGGWKLLSGGPDQLAAAQRAAVGSAERLEVVLRDVQGAELARQQVAASWCRRLTAPEVDWHEPGRWDAVPADAELRLDLVVNPWAQHPDSSRWWLGEHDLSGRVWLRADARHLMVLAAVRDDHHRPAVGAGTLERGDALRIALSGGGQVLQLAVDGQGAVFRRAGAAWIPAADQTEARVQRQDAAGTTWYALALPRAALAAGRVAVDVLAVDDDFGDFKQSAALAPGIDLGQAGADWIQAALP